MSDERGGLRVGGEGRRVRGGMALGIAAGAAATLIARDLGLPSYVSYWGDASPLVVAGTLLFGVLWLTPLRRVLEAIAVALAVAWCLVAFTPISSQLAEGLARRDAPGQGDAVVVLASRLQEDGELTSVAMSRLLHGLELVAQGRAERLVLTELPPPYKAYALPARELAIALGLHLELHVVGPVERTRDEARAVAQLFRSEGWRRALLVTSPSHSRRAAASFEKEGLEIVSSPATETRWDLERLERSDERLAAFGSLVHERIGMLVYRRRGWID